MVNHLPPHNDLRLENGELREEFPEIPSDTRDVNHKDTEAQPRHHAEALASLCLSGLVFGFSAKIVDSSPGVRATAAILQ